MVVSVQQVLGGDEVGALVLDVGACNFRAGFGGEDCPRLTGTSAALAQDDRLRAGISFYRKEVDAEVKPCLTFENKRVEINQEVFEAIAEHSFSSPRGLPGLDLTSSPIILTEPNRLSPGFRKAVFETCFEKLNAPAALTLRKAVAASFSAGRGSAVVVDVGASHLSVCPVYDGFALQRATQEFPVGGDLLDACIDQLLLRKGVNATSRFWRDEYAVRKGFIHQARMAVIKDLKHDCCKLAFDTAIPAGAFAAWNLGKAEEVMFELPDGTRVDVGGFCPIVPELLFESFPLTASPLPGVVADVGGFQGLVSAVGSAVAAIDVDVRKAVASEIVVVGGSTMFPKFCERLHRGLVAGDEHRAAPLSMIPKLKITAAPRSVERMSASWLGCSIAASLGSFQHLWVSKQQYQENGADRFLEKQIIF